VAEPGRAQEARSAREGATGTRRKGRGRLSSIDLLPEEAGPIVRWALAELRDRNRHQTDIHAEFNERLAEIGLGPISFSAFNRKSLRIAAHARIREETREIASVINERREPGESDDLTVLVSESIKIVVFELIEAAEGGRIDPRAVMEASRALHYAVQAQKISAGERARLEADWNAKAAKAVDAVGKAKGLSAETVGQIKAQILGVEP